MTLRPAEKVARLGISRDDGFVYFVQGAAVWRVAIPAEPGAAPEFVAAGGFAPQHDFVYFLDADGDVVRAPTGRPQAAPSATKGLGGLSFEDAFEPLRAYVDTPVWLLIAEADRALAMGEHPITVFEWPALDDDARATLLESQLLELAAAREPGWDDRLVPIALVGGESHPVPLDELDQQTDGVLLVDLTTREVFYCRSAAEPTGARIAMDPAELALLGADER